MKFKSLSIVIAVIVSAMLPQKSFSQEHRVEGTVFLDEDSDCMRSKREKGVASVAVSDGFSVVLTDKKGHYELTLNPKARFVTVYTPSGYRNTNRFFTDVRGLVAGQPMDGECSNRSNRGYDFGLVKCREYGSFAHMSDIEERSYRPWIDRLRDYSFAHNHDFMAITGDICYADGLVLMSKSINERTMGCRVIYTIGNHDLIKGNTDYLGNPYGEKNFEDCFGPSWYAFAVGGLHFIVTPMMAGDAKPSYTYEDIQSWLKAYMAVIPQDEPMVLFNHDANDRLIPEEGNVKAFVYGHHHTDYRSVSDAGIPFFCTMASNKAGNDHCPAALRQMNFSREGITSTLLRYAPLSNHIVSHTAVVGCDTNVYAVVYDEAAEVDKVTLILADGQELSMERADDMMWEAKLPYAAGSYKVKAEFSDGETAIAASFAEPALKWMNSIGSKPYLSNPVLSDGHIYVATIDNDLSGNCGIYSLSAKDGSTEWFFRSGNSIQGDIALVDGVIYAEDADYCLYAVNASDGTLKWSKRTTSVHYPSCTEGVYVKDGIVYGGSGRNLCALKASDGSLVWSNSHKHGTITNVCTNRSTAGALLTNGYWVGRFCYDAASGAFLWENKEYQSRYSTCTPAVLDTTFIYTGYSSLIQVGARGGEVLKMKEHNTIFNVKSEPLIVGDKVFVGTSRDGIFAANLEDFSQAWLYQTEPSLIYTSPYTKNKEKTVECSPVAYGDSIIIGANDGYVYCLRQANGRFVWRINVGLPVVNKPVIDGDNLVIIDFAGNMYCYDLKSL